MTEIASRIPRVRYNAFESSAVCPHCGETVRRKYAAFVAPDRKYRIRYHRCSNPMCWDTFTSIEKNIGL